MNTWLVYFGRDQNTPVKAHSLDVSAGTLIFRSESQAIVCAYAPGFWSAVKFAFADPAFAPALSETSTTFA